MCDQSWDMRSESGRVTGIRTAIGVRMYDRSWDMRSKLGCTTRARKCGQSRDVHPES
jgi:hypothetical protein